MDYHQIRQPTKRKKTKLKTSHANRAETKDVVEIDDIEIKISQIKNLGRDEFEDIRMQLQK